MKWMRSEGTPLCLPCSRRPTGQFLTPSWKPLRCPERLRSSSRSSLPSGLLHMCRLHVTMPEVKAVSVLFLRTKGDIYCFT